MGSELGQKIVEVFLTIVVCLTTTVFSIATKNWTYFFNRQVFGRALGWNECLIQWLRECHMNGWMLSRHLQDLTQRCFLTAFAGLVELWIYTEKHWNFDWNSPNLLTGRQFRQVYICISFKQRHHSETSSAYGTKSSNCPHQQHVPHSHVDFLSENNHIQYWYSPKLTAASRFQHETTLAHVLEVVSNILSLVYTKLFSFVITVRNMTCDLVSYVVSYMDSYMDCDIIPGHFLWHERFMNGSERFRTVHNAEKNIVTCLICLNLLRRHFVIQKCWSLGRVDEPLLPSAVAMYVGSVSLHTFIEWNLVRVPFGLAALLHLCFCPCPCLKLVHVYGVSYYSEGSLGFGLIGKARAMMWIWCCIAATAFIIGEVGQNTRSTMNRSEPFIWGG